MKIELLQENLTKALSVVSRSVSTKATLPVLSHILFKAASGNLTLSATNLETGVKYGVPCKVEEEGEMSVPARVILEYISLLPSGKTVLSSDGSQLLIKNGSFEAKIDGMASSEFPKLPVFPQSELLSFSKKDFARVASWVCFSAATDEGRPILTGVKTVIKDGEVAFAATDGYRLSVLRLKTSKKKEVDLSMIIPARSLVEAFKIINELDDKEGLLFAITEEKNQAIFVSGEVELSTRLIEGSFPNFEKIIPSSSVVKAEIPVDGFLKAVRAASVFARDSANIIKLGFFEKSGGVAVSANAPQVGSNISLAEAKISGGEVEAAFNSRFLVEFLANVGTGIVEFSTEGPLSPGVFKIIGEDNYLHVIMPVRVQ